MTMLWIVWLLSLLLIPFKLIILLICKHTGWFTNHYVPNKLLLENMTNLSSDNLRFIFKYDREICRVSPSGLMGLVYQEQIFNERLFSPNSKTLNDSISFGFLLLNLALKKPSEKNDQYGLILGNNLKVTPTTISWEYSTNSIKLFSIFDIFGIVKLLATLEVIHRLTPSPKWRIWYKRFRFISLPILLLGTPPLMKNKDNDVDLIGAYLYSLAGDLAVNRYDYIFKPFRHELYDICSEYSLILGALERRFSGEGILYLSDYLYYRGLFTLVGGTFDEFKEIWGDAEDVTELTKSKIKELCPIRNHTVAPPLVSQTDEDYKFTVLALSCLDNTV